MRKIHVLHIFIVFLANIFFSSCLDDEAKIVRTIDDVKDAKIGVLTGSAADILTSKIYDEKQIVRFNMGPDMFMALDAGKVDVLIDESMGLPMIAINYPHFQHFDFPYGKNLDIAIGVSKNNNELYREMSSFIDSLKAVGKIDELFKKWSTEDGVLGNVDMARSKGNGSPIRVSTSADYAPFTFVYDGKVTGLEPELVELFAQSRNRKVEYYIVDFPAVIPHIKQGLSDVACAALAPADDRGDNLLFTSPYTSSRPVCVINGKLLSKDEESWSLSPAEMFKSLKDAVYANLIKEDRYKMVIDGLGITLVITALSLLFATLLGALLCWMRMNKRQWMVRIAKVYIEFMRGMPVLVLMMLLFYVVLVSLHLTGTTVAIITFSLYSSAYFCEMFRTVIISIDRGQTEAGLALGFSPLQTFRYIILPQAVRAIIPVYTSEVVTLLKGTAIVGYIAVTDLTKAGDLIRSRTFDAFFPLIMVSIIYFVLAWLIGFALRKLSQRKVSAICEDEMEGDADLQINTSAILEKKTEQTDDEPLIAVRNLSKTYANGHEVLHNVNADIMRGEVISIIGPSGTGKSTFLRCLNQLEEATSGSIVIEGEDILDRNTDISRLRQKMGMVFQSFNLFNGKTILENITLAPVKLMGKSPEDARKEALALLGMVGLRSKANQYPDQLSGGQKQRVAIARALAMEPKILLFDEPTSALDPSMVSEVLTVINSLAQKGMTMLVVTHEMRFAHNISSRIFFMDEKGIYEEGTPTQIFEHPDKKNTQVFIYGIRECRHTITHDNDFYGMMGRFMHFCQTNSLNFNTGNKVFHVIEEILLTIGSPIDTEIILTYCEKSSQVELTFKAPDAIDKDIFDIEANSIQADIIRGCSDSITIEDNTIHVVVNTTD